MAIACSLPQPTPISSSSQALSSGLPPTIAPATETPTIPSPDPIADAMAWRRLLGLRADEAFVRALAADPETTARAELAGYPFPLTEPEVFAMQRRTETFGAISTAAEAYGLRYPAEYGGGFVDTDNWRYVFLVTANVEQHREELSALLPIGSPLSVLQVRWSLAELQPLLQQALDDDAFFDSLGVFAIPDIDERENVVSIDLRTDDPGDVQRVAARYGNDPRIRVRVFGAGPWKGGRGDVLVRVVDESGAPTTPEGAVCYLVADDLRAWSTDEPENAVQDGRCQFRHVGATGVEVQVRMGTSAGSILASARGLVVAGSTILIEVRVAEPST